MQTPALAPTAGRRYDLDWLRIGAFGLLILYHTGMFYVTWDWHVKSADASHAIEPAMLLVNPWRLDLLFFISGVATRFMADRTSGIALAGSRFHRLFWPLLFAIFVIVPPQSYYQLVEHGIRETPWSFYAKYATGFHGWCDKGGCLTVPTYNHMWFVLYLLTYSLAFAALWPLLRRLPWGWAGRAPGWLFLFAPFLVLWAARATLLPVFGDTHAFVGDWYLHAIYVFLFGLGVLVAKSDKVFDACVRWRWASLGVALLAYGGILAANAAYPGDAHPDSVTWALFRGVHELQAWAAICALIGFARRHLAGRDGPARHWLTQAVFPFYLIHQTIIVVAGHYIDKLPWPVALEGSALVAITAAGCLIFAILAERSGPLRPLFGLSASAGLGRKASPDRRA